MAHGRSMGMGFDDGRGEPEGEGVGARDWTRTVAGLGFAFQPIVNCHTGACYGVEAFLRGVAGAGFEDVGALLDAAAAAGAIVAVEEAIHAKAIAGFKTIPGWKAMKLFLNADVRAISAPGYVQERLLGPNRIDIETVVLEVSEGRRPGAHSAPQETLRALREAAVRVALDDFGVGHSSLEQLYFVEPDFIKVNRFFIAGVAQDQKKKLFLSHIVTIAHLLGITVVAEGVESEHEFLACKETGCDLVQGYVIMRPTEHPKGIPDDFPCVAELARKERRQALAWDQRIVRDEMSRMEPLPIDTDMLSVFETFRTHRAMSFYPVVDHWGEPLGIVRDRDLKEHAYSMFGIERLVSSGERLTLPRFVVRCPIADVNSKAESVLRTFSANPSAECILLVDQRRYVGFLSARSLLRLMNEKSMAAARDQNPLTNLPGNSRVHSLLAAAAEDVASGYSVVWLDFDNFKPFNDKYGFRLGDRALLMFAEAIVRESIPFGAFVGHIGGDDFFALFKGGDHADHERAVLAATARFGRDVESLYDEADRVAGCIVAADRAGRERRFPLLSCSSAVVVLEAGRLAADHDGIVRLAAVVKKEAKEAGGFARATVGQGPAVPPRHRPKGPLASRS